MATDSDGNSVASGNNAALPENVDNNMMQDPISQPKGTTQRDGEEEDDDDDVDNEDGYPLFENVEEEVAYYKSLVQQMQKHGSMHVDSQPTSEVTVGSGFGVGHFHPGTNYSVNSSCSHSMNSTKSTTRTDFETTNGTDENVCIINPACDGNQHILYEKDMQQDPKQLAKLHGINNHGHELRDKPSSTCEIKLKDIKARVYTEEGGIILQSIEPYIQDLKRTCLRYVMIFACVIVLYTYSSFMTFICFKQQAIINCWLQIG